MNAAVLEDEWIDADAPRPLDVPKGYELIDGELVEMPDMCAKSSWVWTELYFQLRSFLAKSKLGIAAGSDASYACWPDRPKHVRKPDVSFIRCDSEQFILPDVNYQVAPDLVVEVISPNDLASELDEKVQEFLDAGTCLFWIVNPVLRTVLIRRADGTLQLLNDPAELSGEGVLPGFKVALADFLPRVPKSDSPVA